MEHGLSMDDIPIYIDLPIFTMKNEPSKDDIPRYLPIQNMIFQHQTSPLRNHGSVGKFHMEGALCLRDVGDSGGCW
jgi:hypothetical protein